MLTLRIRQGGSSYKFRDAYNSRAITLGEVRQQGEINIVVPKGWTKFLVQDAEESLEGTKINWIQNNKFKRN